MQKYLRPTIAKIWMSLCLGGLVIIMAACGSAAATSSGNSAPTAAPTSSIPTMSATPTVAATPTSAATPTTAPTGSGNAISIASYAFSPDSLTIKVGTKLTWTNNDSVTHTVTADQGAFNSGPLPSGKSYSFTFTKAGTYTYHCAIHPSMTATIVVQ